MKEQKEKAVKNFPIRRGNFMFNIHMNERKGVTVATFETMTGKGGMAHMFREMCKGIEGKSILHKEDKFDAHVGVRVAIQNCFKKMKSLICNAIADKTNRVMNVMDDLEANIFCNGSTTPEALQDFFNYKERKHVCKCGGCK